MASLLIFTVQFTGNRGRVMTGVVFIFVRDDASDVEALAEAFELAGYSISGNDASDDALSVVVWSRAALRSPAFGAAADRALHAARVIVASLVTPPDRDLVRGVRVVDISAWDGIESDALDPLFDAVLDIAHPVHANIIALPGPIYQDAEFTEAPLQIASDVGASRARAAWEAPIPTILLRPVQEPLRDYEPQLKLGAPSPRRDFRRLRQPQNRAHAALAFAVIALIGGASFALNVPATTPAAPHVEQAQESETGGVSLTSASTDAIGLEDVTPRERARLFEPAQQVGHAGVEPPSARSVRAPAYTSRHTRRDRSADETSTAISAGVPQQSASVLVERSKTGPMS